jgi:hypothetical protein
VSKPVIVLGLTSVDCEGFLTFSLRRLQKVLYWNARVIQLLAIGRFLWRFVRLGV